MRASTVSAAVSASIGAEEERPRDSHVTDRDCPHLRLWLRRDTRALP